MKSLFVFLIVLVSNTFAAKAVDPGERFASSKVCKTCHARIVQEWEKSWHAKSHFAKDEYFQKSLKYVSRKTRKSLNSVKVQCATCHNPRISVTSTDESYEIAAVMGLDKGSEVDKAVNDAKISEGINCVVCHNINKIHDEYAADKRGINRVEWTKSGTMTGPYKDAKSPYHKTIHHDFMDKTPNRLCFVCHANDRSVHGVVFTNMQKEYKGKQTCVSCHMGPRQKGMAATYRYNGKAKIRNVRDHSFAGGHIESMWKKALRLELRQDKHSLYIKIKNPQPHNIPSGFGSREIIAVVEFMKNDKVLDVHEISFSRYYIVSPEKPTF